MPIRSTTQAGNSVIHSESTLVKDVSSLEVQKVIQDLVDTMRHTELVGMAAPQIGENVRIFVTEIRETDLRQRGTDDLKVFINPKIIDSSTETVADYEGCGSVAEAGLFGPVGRAKKVTVRALDQSGKSFTLEADGLLARIIQHEIDHLDGVLFLEKVADMRTVMSRGEYLKMRQNSSDEDT